MKEGPQKRTTDNAIPSIHPLRNILIVDAATCFLMGALLVILCDPIAGLTESPAGQLLSAGILLVSVARFMLLVGLRWPGNAFVVWMIVLANAAWVLASLAPVGGAIAPNAQGHTFILAQAQLVALPAWLESRGARAA